MRVTEEYLGRKIIKYFDGEPYIGTIDRVGAFAHVTYNDGDEEEFTLAEVRKLEVKLEDARKRR